jgi:hypothetical protein
MYTSLLLALLPAAFAAPLIKPRDATLIPGKYIVKFKGEMSATAADDIKASIAKSPDFDYSFGGFTGFAGALTDEEVAKLQANDAVCSTFYYSAESTNSV